MSGKKKAVNKRASKFQARRIFYHNSAGRKVQYENFRLHLVPLLISNLLPACDPTNFLPLALLYLSLSLSLDSTLIMQKFLLLNPLGKGTPNPAYKRESIVYGTRADFPREIQIEWSDFVAVRVKFSRYVREFSFLCPLEGKLQAAWLTGWRGLPGVVAKSNRWSVRQYRVNVDYNCRRGEENGPC